MSVRNKFALRFYKKVMRVASVCGNRSYRFKAELPYYTKCRTHRRFTRNNIDPTDDYNGAMMVRRLFRILK